MNSRYDFTAKSEVEYLGSPIRKRLLVDELRAEDLFNDSSVPDPNGTYRQIESIVFYPTQAVTTGDAKIRITIPFDGALVAVQGDVDTASTSGSVQVSLTNKNGNDFLAGWIEIDANKKSSHNSSYLPVISSTYKAVSRYDTVNVNVDAAGTGTLGLVVSLYFVVTKFYYS